MPWNLWLQGAPWHGLAATQVCQATEPGSPLGNFQSLWTICSRCVQRRASSVARPVLPGCRVISSLRQSWSSIPSKHLQLPTDIEMNFVNFFPLNIWIPMVKFSSFSFTQELPWIMFWFRNITSIFLVRTRKLSISEHCSFLWDKKSDLPTDLTKDLNVADLLAAGTG